MPRTSKFKQSLIEWSKNNLTVTPTIYDADSVIRGIYGIFVVDSDKKCVYVGKSSNIHDRMFNCNNGHITKIKSKKHFIDSLNSGKEIIIEVLEEVPYQFDDYYKDMQRLASRENYYIDAYQKNDQCLYQVPEGRHVSLKKWESWKNPKK